MNRREFTYTAVAGTAMLAFASKASSLAAPADKYDLVIRGGRVLDPASRLDAVRDVAISQGRVAAVGTNIAGTAVAERMQVEHGCCAGIHQEAERTVPHAHGNHVQAIAAFECNLLRLQ